MVDLNDVIDIAESPHRLPVRFANRLYDAGETGMGYTLFTIEFADGTRAAYETGNAVDFIQYPPGQSGETIVKINPHDGRDDPHRQTCIDYKWCLYAER